MQRDDAGPTEAERLARVYGEYAQSAGKQDAWSNSNAGSAAILAGFRRALKQTLAKHGWTDLTSAVVLEIGCGSGANLEFFKSVGAKPESIHGVDIIPERAEAARANHPDARIVVADAQALPYPDQTFDVVLVSVVFSSILDQTIARNVANEMVRVLKPGGLVLWYDARIPNPWNPNVKRYGRAEVEDLFPTLGIDLRSITLLPPIARRLPPRLIRLYAWLELLPPLRTHLVGALTKLQTES